MKAFLGFLYGSAVFRLVIGTCIGFCKPSNFSLFDFLKKSHWFVSVFWPYAFPTSQPECPALCAAPAQTHHSRGYLSTAPLKPLLPQRANAEAGSEQVVDVQHRFGISDPWFLLTSGKALSPNSSSHMLWGHCSSAVDVPQPKSLAD